MYVAADVGTTRASADFSGSHASESSTGYQVRFGYQFSRYFAVEVGYVDFGSFDFKYRPTCVPVDACNIDTHATSHGPLANAVVIWPLSDRWQLKGRAGLSWLSTSSRQSGPGTPDSPSNNFTDKATGVSFGAAATYRLNDNIDLELSFTHYDQIDYGLSFVNIPTMFSTGSSTMAAVGIAYRF